MIKPTVVTDSDTAHEVTLESIPKPAPAVTAKKKSTASTGATKAVSQSLPVDLTQSVKGVWPGNAPTCIGSYYFDLNRMDLLPEQPGLLGSLCENFVFERVDLHLLSVPDDDWSLDIELIDTCFLGGFHGHASIKEVNNHGVNEDMDLTQMMSIGPGTCLSKERVYLRPRFKLPQQGRMLLSFIGYLIEPWR